MKSCEKKVKDSADDGARAERPGSSRIDDFELEKRAHISDMRQELEGMQQYFDGDEVKRR